MRVNKFIYLFKGNKCLFLFNWISMGVSESERPLELRAKNYPKNITSSRVPTCQHLGNLNNILRSKSHQERQKIGQCNSSNERQSSPWWEPQPSQEKNDGCKWKHRKGTRNPTKLSKSRSKHFKVSIFQFAFTPSAKNSLSIKQRNTLYLKLIHL